ncbi:glycoside hydrolase family 130 protein [Actomonas aquatica]|uniref:Glycoside hydrolase family 130 protein n=1 Tax=Actomonas aquatica TaxID=2866162 RepID=A0ABZ1C251_9BACT|nr:glycoside hydrolase family 130 protein [Opitutus sp. WL0086]WRQ85752.1 glycoside hydrolase family 130 protein [Opitutus sp. WL0086]
MQRHSQNPVLTARQVPYPATLVFNAGVVYHDGRYVMVFRNDYGRDGDPQFDGTNIGLAISRDGVNWTVEPQPLFALEDVQAAFRDVLRHRYPANWVRRIYDPRLTVIDGRIYMCFAIDTGHGISGGVATTEDFKTFQWLSVSAPDSRNMVLFPRKFGGKYVRLERPFPVYMREDPEAFPIWCGESPDLVHWGHHRPVLGPDEVPFANSKIGPAAPPIETERGWLTSFHAVYKDPNLRLEGWEPQGWFKTYHSGLMLLDKDDPSKVIGMAREPLIMPEADYEVNGFRGSVIFPCGMILEPGGEVKLYYGAADTSVALATAHVDDLLARIEPF